MRYLILRKADAATEASALPSAALIEAMGRYHQQLVDARVLLAGEGLHPSKGAVRLSLAPGQATIVDGPFTETKELVAGFSVFEVASKQEAIDWVRRWPVEDGDGNVEIEIREAGCHGGCLQVVAPADAPTGGKRFAILLRSSADLESEAPVEQARLDRTDAHTITETKAGVLLGASGLRTSALGARVKFKEGRPTVIDGPFTEIKELIAGYWLIRAESLQHAIDWARRNPYPVGPHVEVEVRQCYEMEELGIAFTDELAQAEQQMRAQQLEAGMRAQLA